MVFYKGVMINRNAYRTGPDDFKPAVATRELAEGQLKRLLVEEQPVLLLNGSFSRSAASPVAWRFSASGGDQEREALPE